MKKVIIIGTGGHSKVIADIIQKNGDKIEGFFDYTKLNKTFLGYPILGDEADYTKYNNCYFIIAIGNSRIREKIYKQLQDAKWYTAIHPQATISSIGVKIGAGTVVMANTVINTNAVIGEQCIINSSSTVEHDNKIENFVHVSVGVKLAGNVSIGNHTWLGIGSTVINNISICKNCTIGAGAVIIKNIDRAGTYVGVPAKFIHD